MLINISVFLLLICLLSVSFIDSPDREPRRVEEKRFSSFLMSLFFFEVTNISLWLTHSRPIFFCWPSSSLIGCQSISHLWIPCPSALATEPLVAILLPGLPPGICHFRILPLPWMLGGLRSTVSPSTAMLTTWQWWWTGHQTNSLWIPLLLVGLECSLGHPRTQSAGGSSGSV